MSGGGVAVSDFSGSMGTSMIGSVSAGVQPPGVSSGDAAVPPFIQSIVSDENEFPPKLSPHSLCEVYCLKELAVLTSASLEPIQNESKLKVLLSSACIAINNSNS